MATFYNNKINKTFQRVVQVNGSRQLQDGLGRLLSGSMGDLEVTGILAVTGSLNITGYPDVSASLASLETFSSSLDNTFASDAELSSVSSSLAVETAQLLNFSASLDATFATDSELQAVSSSIVNTINSLPHSDISALNAATSSYALKSEVSGSFTQLSGSIVGRIETLEYFSSSLDATFATDAELESISSSFASTIEGISAVDISALNNATSSYALKTEISGSTDLLSGSIASRFERLEYFSSSLDATYATDAFVTTSISEAINPINAATSSYALKTEISGSFLASSASIVSRVEVLEEFSSSLDATFATDDQVVQAVSGLNDATSSFALKTEISGSFTLTSASLAFDISGSKIDILNNTSKIDNLIAVTSSYAVHNADNFFSTDQTIVGQLFASSSRLGSHNWAGQTLGTKAQFNDFVLEQNRDSNDGTDFFFLKSRGIPGAETHAVVGDEVFNLRALVYKSGSTATGTSLTFNDFDTVSGIQSIVQEIAPGTASGDLNLYTKGIDGTYYNLILDCFGNVSASNAISASTYYGDGSNLTNINSASYAVTASYATSAASIPQVGSGLGWARYDDGVYTTGSFFSLTVAQGEVVLPNSGSSAIETNLVSSIPFYNSGSAKIQVENEGDVYMMTVVFRAKAANVNGTYLTLHLASTGATPYNRVTKSIFFPKGNDQWHDIHEVFQFYADADFVTNGNQWRATAHGNTVDIADIIYFIQRTQNNS